LHLLQVTLVFLHPSQRRGGRVVKTESICLPSGETHFSIVLLARMKTPTKN
jgi:hypothetical protein